MLARQLLLARESISPLQAIERLAGMQAQQSQPPFVGLWTRIPDFKREHLANLIATREVVRATSMRATLHLLSANDFLKWRQALQPSLTAAVQSILRSRTDGMDTQRILAAAGKIFDQPHSFQQLRSGLANEFPGVDERAMGYLVRTHLPLVAVPDGSPWSYPADSNFVLSHSWLGRSPDGAENVETLILRYLAAFGPATPADMQTWSGIPKLQPAFEALRPKLRTFRDERKRELFDLPEAPRPEADTPVPVRFLPGFDNILLAHAIRTRIIADEHRPRIATKNLLILPTFLVDGFVAGTWSVSRQKDRATLTISPFARLTTKWKRELIAEAESLLRFVAPEAVQRNVEIQDL